MSVLNQIASFGKRGTGSPGAGLAYGLQAQRLGMQKQQMEEQKVERMAQLERDARVKAESAERDYTRGGVEAMMSASPQDRPDVYQGWLIGARQRGFDVQGAPPEYSDQILATMAGQTGVQFGQDPSAPAGLREFQEMTKYLSDSDDAPDEVKRAARISLGLEERAVGAAAKTVDIGGVPHIFDPTTKSMVPVTVDEKTITAETVGDTKATIAQRKKFGELTGASRAKAIDSGYESVVKIDKNISNLDKAIAAIEAGAGTGAIERRFPSIKAASVELDQIQNELALDVIGSVTFGALSEGELELARQTALPAGLDGPELIQHLSDRKTAQEKLRNYFREQIDFLDNGGTIAGFLRSKERDVAGQTPSAGAPDPSGDQAPPTVATQDEYNALPSGAIFIEDGVQYRKP